MSKILTVLACVAFICIAFFDVQAFVENARRGMMVFGQSVLPVLFPFFFISGLLIEISTKFNRPAYFALSYLAGFPTSARMLSIAYNRGQIDRATALRLAPYTSTTSPIFIIATLGTALYGNTMLGILIFTAHILGAIATGVVWNVLIPKMLAVAELVCRLRRHRRHSVEAPHSDSPHRCAFSESKHSTPEQPTPRIDIADAVSRSLHGAVSSVLMVGGLIIMFFIACAAMPLWCALIMEMTTAVFNLEPILGGIWRAVIPCAIVSFGGLCLALQGFVFLKDFRMPVRYYLLYKIVHTVFAVIICIGIYAVIQF